MIDKTRDSRALITAKTHPLKHEIFKTSVLEGESIKDIAAKIYGPGMSAENLEIKVDGRRVDFETYKVKSSEMVQMAIRLRGGGAGKDVLRFVAVIGVVALSAYTGGAVGAAYGTVVGSLVQAGMTIGGMLLINALIPPTRPGLPGTDSAEIGENQPTATGGSNRANLYGPIPVICGRLRMTPPLGAKPYTEIVGSQQYLRMLFVWGFGPIQISAIKIGETPLEEYNSYEIEHRQGYDADAPLTLFTKSVNEESLSVKLTPGGDQSKWQVWKTKSWTQRTTDPDTDEFSIDITFPAGLYYIDLTGATKPVSLWLLVDYKLTTSGTWTSNYFQIKRNNRGNFIVGERFKVTRGQYDIRVAVVSDLAVADYLAYKGYTAGSTLTIDSAGEIFPTGHAHPVDTYLGAALDNVEKITMTWGGGGDIVSPELVLWPVNSAHDIQFPQTLGSNISASFRKLSDSDQWRSFRQLGYFWYEENVHASPEVGTEGGFVYECYWTKLRSITNEDPIKGPAGLAKTAIRIKATDQLNGVISELTGFVESIVPTWNGSDWATLAVSNNPAAIFRRVLTSPNGIDTPLPVSRLDSASIQDWYDDCVTEGRAFNFVFDNRISVRETLAMIASVGRASPTLINNKWGVIQDKYDGIPVQHFSPRNSSGFQGSKQFIDLPHALRITFSNENQDFQQDEMIVYDDGYDSSTATIFEGMDFPGITNPDQVWKMGRYHIATARLRPETYTFTTDFENLICTRGDLIRFTHDVPLFGLASGRILEVIDDTVNVTHIVLDEIVEMETGKSYVVRMRYQDLSSVLKEVDTIAGSSNTLQFTTPFAIAGAPSIGDLVLFGEQGTESVELKVIGIEPGDDLTAVLTCVDAAPAILSADQGTIPPYNSNISFPPEIALVPSPPIISGVISDERVLSINPNGTIIPAIQITIEASTAQGAIISHTEIQYRISSSVTNVSNPWKIAGVYPVQVSQITINNVNQAETYDIRARYITFGQLTSVWTYVLDHYVSGSTNPPADVLSGAIYPDNGFILWDYTAPSDFAGFRVKYQYGTNPQWEGAIPVGSGFQSPPLLADLIPPGIMTLMIKAVDLNGNESTNPGVLVWDFQDQEIENVLRIIDEKADGFPNTKTGCTVTAGNLVADSTADFWSNDAANFWTNNFNLFWGSSYSPMTYEFPFLPTAQEALKATAKLDYIINVDAQYRIEYFTESVAAFWNSNINAGFWNSDAELFWLTESLSYLPWTGRLEHLKRQNYTIRISADWSTAQTVISKLQLLFDYPTIYEYFYDLYIADVGTRIPLLKDYIEIKTVLASIILHTSDATHVVTHDKDPVNGPLMHLHKGTGSATVDGYIDAVVTGY